jgi:hypothetical protein
MIEDQTTQNPATDPILARNASGREHHVEVAEDTVGAGLVVIRDDGMTRFCPSRPHSIWLGRL